MTFEAVRMARRTDRGSGAPPAARARVAWCCSSVCIRLRRARLRRSPSGSRARWSSRCSTTWRSVSTMNPRLHRSPASPGRGADGERAGEPERVEPARRRAELFEPRPAPDEVVVLFASRLLHRFPGPGIARHQRLPPVERLGGDLARVVDPHQRRRMAAFTVVEHVVRDVAGGTLGSGAGVHARGAAQRAVERDEEAVQPIDVAPAG